MPGTHCNRANLPKLFSIAWTELKGAVLTNAALVDGISLDDNFSWEMTTVLLSCSMKAWDYSTMKMLLSSGHIPLNIMASKSSHTSAYTEVVFLEA